MTYGAFVPQNLTFMTPKGIDAPRMQCSFKAEASTKTEHVSKML
jgi:hypothetical protein